MAGSPLIVALAVGMLVYWFRYACTLVLRKRTESEFVARVDAANGLTFLLVRSQLQLGEGPLDVLRKSLDHDYRLLLYLLRNARGRGVDSLEQRLLLWDHLLMSVWYWTVRGISATLARK